VAYLVFSPGPSKPRPPIVARSAGVIDELIIGEPFIFENLAVFPVSSKTPRLSDRFITLDEGLRAGTIEIRERGAVVEGNQASGGDPFAAPPSPATVERDPFAAQPAVSPPAAAADPFAEVAAQSPPATISDSSETVTSQTTQQAAPEQRPRSNSVNELTVVNRSDKPLYLMPGEIIIGGDQDRTIAEEIVIAANGQPTAISVFCVEHGRWGGKGQAEYARIVSNAATSETAGALAVDLAPTRSITGYSANLSLVVDPEQIAKEANSGKFVGTVGSLNKSVRVAVQGGEGQGKVWEEVASQNAKAEVREATGTFVGNYADDKSVERLAPFLKQLQEPVREMTNVVGVIVAVNGEPESMDVFESTPLFRKLWPKLLKSYALDASSAEPTRSDAKQATADDAKRFLRDIVTAKNKKEDTKGDLALSQSESDDVLVFTVHERKGQGDAAATTGGFGGMGMGGGFFGGAVHSAGFSK
jgi:hypothetical protein